LVRDLTEPLHKESNSRTNLAYQQNQAPVGKSKTSQTDPVSEHPVDKAVALIEWKNQTGIWLATAKMNPAWEARSWCRSENFERGNNRTKWEIQIGGGKQKTSSSEE
jgi:hypothetical protein